MPVTLRPAGTEDEAFLYELYASTRNQEMATWGWADAQREMFLKMQFTARTGHYKRQFKGADHHIIILDGEKIGRLYVLRNDREILLVDIALLPKHQGGGVGSGLIRDLQDEARKTGKPVLLHVEKTNSALRLYERLGFARVDENDTHFEMKWFPDT